MANVIASMACYLMCLQPLQLLEVDADFSSYGQAFSSVDTATICMSGSLVSLLLKLMRSVVSGHWMSSYDNLASKLLLLSALIAGHLFIQDAWVKDVWRCNEGGGSWSPLFSRPFNDWELEEARTLWVLLFSMFGVQWVLPATVKEMLLGWNGSFVGKKRKGVWKASPLCLFWTVWKTRNKVAFEEEELSIQRLKALDGLLTSPPSVLHGTQVEAG
uniref:Uncharacterized protein n=1 Tax=Vitis vinifera TaxID=29760 RepID=A5C5T9_VITVI|nr:hypothetical protein VITISV_003573 [Vitis vinifera]